MAGKALKQVARGAGIIFIGGIFAYLSNFIYRLIISRYLGPAEYGLISLGQMMLSFGILIALLGLNQGMIRYVSYYRAKKDLSKVKGYLLGSLKISLPISILISFLIIFFSGFISNNIFHSAAFQKILIIFGVTIPFNVILVYLTNFFLAYKKPEYKEIVRTFCRNVFNLIITIFVVIIGGSVLQISYAYLTAIIISIIIGFFILEKKVMPLVRSKTKASYDYNKLLKFSLPLFFSGVFLDIMKWADTFFLGYFTNEIQVGIYNVAFPLAAGLGIFLASISVMFFPIVSELIAKKNHKEISSIFEVALRWIFISAFPIALLIILFPEYIIKFLFGKEYIAGSTALVVITLGYFVHVITGPSQQIILAFEKTKYLFKLNSIIVTLNLILNIILIPIYGINGAAYATAISLALKEMIIFFKVKTMIKFRYDFRYYFKYMLSAIIPLFLVYSILIYFFRPYSTIELIIALILYSISYLTLLFLFKGFSKEDIGIMLAIEKKFGLNLKFIKKILKKYI